MTATLAVLGSVVFRGHNQISQGVQVAVQPAYRPPVPDLEDAKRIALSLGNGWDGAAAYLTPPQARMLAAALLDASDQEDDR